MVICFLDNGGFSSSNLPLHLNHIENDLNYNIFTSMEDVKKFLQNENIHILFTEFSNANELVVEFISDVRRIKKNITIVNKIPHLSIPANSFIESGFDSYFYAKDLITLPHIIDLERLRQTEKREREMLLHQLEASHKELQFQKFALDQSVIVTISDREGKITYVNEKFCEVTGFKKHEVLGQTHRILNSGHHSKELWENFYDTLLHGKVWRGEIHNKKKNGEPLWMEVTVVPFFNSQGMLIKYVAIHFDITYRVLAEERLTRNAFYDPLTNLPNRSFFLAKIEVMIGLYRNRIDHHLCLLVLNLKSFNRINNMYGYSFGDQVITEIVSRLIDYISTKEWRLSRLGGDNFGVLALLDSNEKKNIGWIGNIFHELFNHPVIINERPIYVEIAIGISFLDESVIDAEELLNYAELAMFESKKNLNIPYKIFEADMMVQIKNRSLIQSELKAAVKNQEFIPYYQPIVESRTGRVEGYEVLMRWHHPKHGIVSPYFFLSIAEESGLIESISHQILYKAFEEFANIRKRFKINESNNKFYLSINLSSEQFNENVFNTLIPHLEKNSLSTNSIHLEITENIAIKDMNRSNSVLNDLALKGFEISLDDFGTGYSSLTYLKKFTIHNLKIDKGFVDGIVNDDKDRIIFKTIVDLARNIGLNVTVEGVETSEQYDIVKNIGVDSIQGFFKSEPLSFEDCLLWTKKNLEISSI